jgi:predicted AlkP superfamily phosphohydrolase/phosphomutase
MNSKKRVLVVGLDGATFDLISPWVKTGKLPFLHDLMENGSYGELTSIIPVLTPPAWSSFMTGKNPGKHGIISFLAREDNGYNIEVANSTYRSAREIWSILSENGKKVGVVNVPFTYPPKKVNGVMITGMMTPPESDDFTYPTSLKEEVKKVIGESPLNPFLTYLEREEVFLNELFESTNRLAKISSYLIKTYKLDLFMVVFNGTDFIQHRFWGYIDPSHPKYRADKSKKYHQIFLSYYQRVDEIIGELARLTGKNATVIVMSDHGAGPLRKYIHINSWLRDTGFLSMKRGFVTRIKRFMYKIGVNPEKIYNTLFKLHIGNLGIKMDKANGKLRFLLKNLFLSFSDVNWLKTKAFSIGSGLIYINLKGRDPLGAVNPGEEYEALRDRLIRRLCRLRDPETGEHIIEKVYRREEIYEGHFVNTAPDLVFIPKQGYMTFEGYEFGAESIVTRAEAVSAAHRPNGILLMKGPYIKRGLELRNAKIMDVAPTLLQILGLPIPMEMDGKVLVDILHPLYMNLNPVKYVMERRPVSPLILKKNGKPYSLEDEEKLKARLQGLGYLP